MTRPSEDRFERTLQQKTREAREKVTNCIRQFISSNPNNRASAARIALDAAERLNDMLHDADRPVWLINLCSNLRSAEKNHSTETGVNAVERIATEYLPLLRDHSWASLEKDSEAGINFDEIYQKYRTECQVTQTFDELIEILQQIVQSEEIDSRKVIKELNKIIDTLRASKKGSYFAVRGASSFLVTWFKNTGWEVLGKIPILGSAVKGLRKTLDQLDSQMKTMHERIYDELDKSISSDFPRIEYQPARLPGPDDGNVDA